MTRTDPDVQRSVSNVPTKHGDRPQPIYPATKIKALTTSEDEVIFQRCGDGRVYLTFPDMLPGVEVQLDRMIDEFSASNPPSEIIKPYGTKYTVLAKMVDDSQSGKALRVAVATERGHPEAVVLVRFLNEHGKNIPFIDGEEVSFSSLNVSFRG